MRRVQRVADQDVFAVMPMRVAHLREAPPDRIIGNQPFAFERVGENLFAEGARFILGHFLETGAAKLASSVSTINVPARRVSIMMRVEIADRRMAEGLRQRVKSGRGAKPGKAVGAIGHAGAELIS